MICVEVAEYSPIGAGRRRTELADFLVAKAYFEVCAYEPECYYGKKRVLVRLAAG